MKLKATQKNKDGKREAPPKFMGRFGADGTLNFGDYTRAHLKQFILENPNMVFELKPLLPESNKQRGYFEGAICPLIAYYQEGMDHHNWKHREAVREWLKMEFNGEMVSVGGKAHRVARSTKNALNQGFLERVVAYVMENYTPGQEVLDPDKYKHWRDTVFPFGGPENYIDYLVEMKLI